MKRILIALALLAAVAALCITCQITLTQQTRALIRQIDTIQTHYDAGDLPSSRAETTRYAEEAAHHTRWFPLFLRHAELISIEETATQLTAILEAGDDKRFPAELARCRRQLTCLLEMERPTWENLL